MRFSTDSDKGWDGLGWEAVGWDGMGWDGLGGGGRGEERRKNSVSFCLLLDIE